MKVLIVDDHNDLIRKILKENIAYLRMIEPTMYELENIQTNQTNDREYGWYHCFDKPNKKNNFKRG